MLNIYRPLFIPYFGSHFENGRHLENFENAELLLRSAVDKFVVRGKKGEEREE